MVGVKEAAIIVQEIQGMSTVALRRGFWALEMQR